MDFSNTTVLLIGDFMIDHYIMGTSNRISPEAPVPVVEVNKEFSHAGGAANVAKNINGCVKNISNYLIKISILLNYNP